METAEVPLDRHLKQKAPLAFASKTVPFGTRDVLDLFDELKKMHRGPAGFFQTSVEGDGSSRVAAFTYFGFDIFEMISVEHGLTHFRRGEKVEVARGEPFREIAARLQKYRVDGEGRSFFARGGAMGHFGFESVKYIEPILREHQGSFQISATSASAVDVELFLFKKIVIFDHRAGSVLILSGLCIDEDAEASVEMHTGALKALEQIERSINAVPAKPDVKVHSRDFSSQVSNIAEVPVEQLSCAMGRSKYVEGVLQLKDHIAAGDIFQAVLSERFEKNSTVSAFDLFRVLVTQSPSAYQFYIEREGGAVLGASPEMLLSVKDRVLETHPIAGTRPRGKDAAEERKFEKQLTQSTKENAEHLMLVDLARNDLGRISVAGTVRVGASAEIKKFPGVMHLVTRVFGELKKEKNAVEALGACFPAGTLSGAPKIRAMQLLSELENLPRGVYGGAVGLLSFDDELEVCIAIRCAEVARGKITFRAGAGIVADSRPDFEYDEILHKTRSLRRAIALAEKIFGNA